MLPWKLRKRHILPVNQNLSSVYFSLAKFQLVSCNLSLAMILQMTYAHKLLKLCSATLMECFVLILKGCFSPWNDKKMVLLHGIFRYTTKGMISYQSLRTTKMNFENLLGEQVFKITIAIRFKLQSSSLSIRASFCILAFVIYTLNVWILINFVTKWF